MTTTQMKQNQTAAPTGLSLNAVAGGGSFTAVAQFYKITAVGAFGESLASTEATATPAAGGHIDVTWTGVPVGTTAVRVYRGTVTNTENVLVFQVQGAFTGTVTDAGGAGTAATPPATASWGNVTKTSGVPTKANRVTGVPSGLNQDIYAGLVGYNLYAPGGTGATRNAKYLTAAGFGLQEV